MSKKPFRKIVLAALCMAAFPLLAQTGKPVEGSKMMSKDELRSCMKLQDSIKTTAAELEARKLKLAEDKAKIAPANEANKALRAEFEALAAAFKAADKAVQEHSARVAQWNAEVKEAESSSMKSAERRKKQLMSERAEMDATNKTLLDDRAEKHKAYEAAVGRYNERAKQTDGMVTAWNQANEKLADDADKLVDLRADYAADCANRRFKEDDEIAIKKELGR